MPSPAWHLAKHSAHLKLGAWDAALDVARPSEGLREWQHQSSPCDLPTALLGVEIDDATLEDVYVRGADLVATYTATPGRPTRVQIYWRAGTNSAGNDLASLTIDLQISVQTHLLDSDPALNATSSFQTDELYRLIRPDAAEFSRNILSGVVPMDQPQIIGPDDRPTCLLARLADCKFSYAEMVHPADHRRDTIKVQSDSTSPQKKQAQVKLAHELFLPPLEKGVILRARLRGVLLPRAGDEAAATAAYEALISAEPPLTT